MRAVVDSSTWISLARSGLLALLDSAGIDAVLPQGVREETVDAGRAGGHADAAAIEPALARHELRAASPTAGNVDAEVLGLSREVGALIANDAALGRRARSLGSRWLSTADLVVLAVRIGTISRVEGERDLDALLAAGRIDDDLADAYREELR
jgi:predicted nucleic acid-binding protein